MRECETANRKHLVNVKTIVYIKYFDILDVTRAEMQNDRAI